jgi:Na+-transporting methylmalonyl-CoA/oxaloacetate decarboxylase gamma subunit
MAPAASQGGRGVAVDAIEAILGQVLLLLIGLAVVLFILILLLVEALYIEHLSTKLGRRLRSDNPDPAGSGSPTAQDDPGGLPLHQQEVR